MTEEDIFIYSLTDIEFQEQFHNIQSSSIEQIVFLAENYISEIHQQDIQNIIYILSQFNFKQIIFEALSNDLSLFMNKQLEDIFLASQNTKKINFFASTNKQFKFQTSIFSQIDDISIKYDELCLEKTKNKLKIILKNPGFFDNYLSLISSLRKNQHLDMEIVITCHDYLSCLSKIRIFNNLYKLLEGYQYFRIIIKNYIEYYHKSKFIFANHKYWYSDQFEEQILNQLQISKLKVQFDLNSERIIIEEETIKIKQKYSQLNEVAIKCQDLFEYSYQNLLNILIDNKLNFEIKFNINSDFKIDFRRNQCMLKQIKDDKVIVAMINYYLSSMDDKSCCQIELSNCQFNLLSQHKMVQKIMQFKKIKVSTSKLSITLNEEEFKIELQAENFKQLKSMLDIIQQSQKSQLYKLKIYNKICIQLMNPNITYLKKNYKFQELKIEFTAELQDNKLELDDWNDQEDFEKILFQYSNLQQLYVNFKSYIKNSDKIISFLPSTLNSINIQYDRYIKLKLDSEHLIAHAIDFQHLDQFRNLIYANKLKHIDIEIYCIKISKQWMELIIQQYELSTFRFHMYFHHRDCENNTCYSEKSLELKTIYLNEKFMLSIQDKINIPLIKYVKNGKLIIYEPSFQIKNSLISQLTYSSLEIKIQNAQELKVVIAFIQSRLNLPKLENVYLLLNERFEADEFQEQLFKMGDQVKKILIYLISKCIMVLDFENKYFFYRIYSHPIFQNRFSNINNYFDKINYESSDLTLCQRIKQLLSPLDQNQRIYLNFNQTQEIVMELFKKLENFQLQIHLNITISDYSFKEFPYQVLDSLAIFVQQGLIRSLQLKMLFFCMIYSQNNLYFVIKESSSKYPNKLDDIIYLSYFIDKLQINIRKVKVILKYSSLKDIICTNSIKDLFLNRKIRHLQVENGDSFAKSNSKIKDLQQYQYHKTILIQFLPKLLKLGIDRFEKIEQFLSFFTSKQKFLKRSTQKIFYIDEEIQKYDKGDYYYVYYNQ